MNFHFRVSLNQFFVVLFLFLFIEVKGKRLKDAFFCVWLCRCACQAADFQAGAPQAQPGQEG